MVLNNTGPVWPTFFFFLLVVTYLLVREQDLVGKIDLVNLLRIAL